MRSLFYTALGFSVHRELYAISNVVVDEVGRVFGIVAPTSGVLKDACPDKVRNPWRPRLVRSADVSTWVVCSDTRMGFGDRGVAKTLRGSVRKVVEECREERAQLSPMFHVAEHSSLVDDRPPAIPTRSSRKGALAYD